MIKKFDWSLAEIPNVKPIIIVFQKMIKPTETFFMIILTSLKLLRLSKCTTNVSIDSSTSNTL